MNKKIYKQPTLQIVNVKQTLMNSATVSEISNNAGLRYGGGDRNISNSAARSRSVNSWDEE